MRDGGRRDVRGLDQARRAASLDFAAKRCALAVGNGGNARRDSPAACGQRGHLGCPRESALGKILRDDGRIVVAVGDPRQEPWWIVREKRP